MALCIARFFSVQGLNFIKLYHTTDIVRGDRDSRANLMPIYGDLYQIKF